MDLRDLVKLAGIVNPELLNKIETTAEVEEAEGAGFEQATTRPEEEVMDDPMQAMGSSADTSLRRYLKAKGDHVTVDEDVYPDHTVESVSEAYAAYKADPVAEATKGCADCEWIKDETDGDIDTCDECAAEKRQTNESEKRWKQTSMSPQEAIEKYGKENVKVKKGALRNGDDMVEVFVESMNEGGTKSVIDMIANADNPSEMVMDLIDRDESIGKFLYSELEQLATEAGTTFNNAESTPEDFVDELLANMGIEESVIDEADVEENAFNQAAAAAARANKSEFEFGGKTHKTTMKKDTAHKLDDDINILTKLAGISEFGQVRLPKPEPKTLPGICPPGDEACAVGPRPNPDHPDYVAPDRPPVQPKRPTDMPIGGGISSLKKLAGLS